MRRSMWLAALGAALVMGIAQAPLAQADNSQH